MRGSHAQDDGVDKCRAMAGVIWRRLRRVNDAVIMRGQRRIPSTMTKHSRAANIKRGRYRRLSLRLLMMRGRNKRRGASDGRCRQ